MAAIAQEKGWTIERLLIYFGLKEPKTEENLLFKLQSSANVLPLIEQIALLAWLSALVQEKVKEKVIAENIIKPRCNKKVLLVIESEDLSLASRYSANLAVHTQLGVENISIATVTKIPETLSDFDLLVVDVTSDESPCISLTEQIEFDGALVVFADSALSEAMRDRLSAPATDLLIKPIPWNELKDKPYFQ